MQTLVHMLALHAVKNYTSYVVPLYACHDKTIHTQALLNTDFHWKKNSRVQRNQKWTMHPTKEELAATYKDAISFFITNKANF